MSHERTWTLRVGKVDSRLVGSVHRQTRPPTLAEQVEVLAEALALGCECVCWYHRGSETSFVIRPCECGNVAPSDGVCRWCRALAQVVYSLDNKSPEDAEARYQLAERQLQRLAEVVVGLKAEARR